MPLRPLILRLQGKDEGITKKLNAITKKLNEAHAPARRLSRAFKDFGKAAGLSRLLSGLRSVGGLMFRIAKRAAIFGAGLVVGLGAAVIKVIDLGDSLAKTAKRFGITTDQLQELQLVFKDANVDSAQLAQGLRFLSAKLGKTKGSTKDLIPTLFQIADRMKTAKTATERSAIAQAAFGKVGSLLIPVLSEGSESIRTQIQAWRELGVILDADTIRAMERADDSINRLKAVGSALSVRLLASLVPTVDRLTTRLEGWIGANRALINQRVTEFSAKLAGWIESLAGKLPGVVSQMGELAGAVTTIANGVAIIGRFGHAVLNPIDTTLAHTQRLSREGQAATRFSRSGITPLRNEAPNLLGGIAPAAPSVPQQVELNIRMFDLSGRAHDLKGQTSPSGVLTLNLDVGRALATP